MNGDINVKINKKVGLLILGATSLFAMADFVSLIDNEHNSYIIEEPMSEHDKEQLLLEIQPVGSVVFRMDNINPTDIYGGTWNLITGDAALSFGDGNNQNGNIIGDNEEDIVLPSHSHSRGNMEISGGYGSHYGGKYYAPYADNDWSGSFRPLRTTGNQMSTTIQITGNGTTSGSGFYFEASKSWTGRTSDEGISNPKMNIRDARIDINVWKRIN